MLERWALTAPDICRVVEEFSGTDDQHDEDDPLPHHEEGQSSQDRFRRHVKDLLDVILNRGNPFEERNNELVTLNNRVCLSDSAVESVRQLECKGQEQYNVFVNTALQSEQSAFSAPIKRNQFQLYHDTKKIKTSALKRKVQHLKDHADLYGKAFLVLESRDGDLKEFFRHESSSYPPSLSSNGKINCCTKSDLLTCILGVNGNAENLVPPDAYDVIINDGGALIHSLPGTAVKGKSFDEYFHQIFTPRLRFDLARSTRVDVVWDEYRTLSIKGDTREKRGSGTRQRVTGAAKVPGEWEQFLSNAENKKELFAYLSTETTELNIQENKVVYITHGDQVLNIGTGSQMGKCNHEEADSRVIVHLLHALKTSSIALIHTGDTDVVVILLTNYHHIVAVNPAAEVWISFRAGRKTRMIYLNSIAERLGSTMCKAMALFHAFTGCDSTSSFKFKGKRFCYKTKDCIPALMEEFSVVTCSPFNTSSTLIALATEFVCRLYSKSLSSTCLDADDANFSNDYNDVDRVRMEVFCRRTRDVERIPPTSDALLQHLRRSVFQASIWASAYLSEIPQQDPEAHGWRSVEGKLVPIWVTLPLATEVLSINVKCSCTKPCVKCKCRSVNLKCTRMCKCLCFHI